MRAKRQFRGRSFSGMRGYLGDNLNTGIALATPSGGGSVSTNYAVAIRAQSGPNAGIIEGVFSSALLDQYISAGGYDILINGNVVQPTQSGGQFFINGQQTCNLFNDCPAGTPVASGVVSRPGPGVSSPLTPQMIPSDTSGQAGTATYITAATSAALAPTLQPNQSGASPTGGAGSGYAASGYGTSGAAYTTVPTNCLGPTIYRFIYYNGTVYQTGSNRGGCSPTNTGACDPQTFTTLSQAIQYALANGETPYKVSSAQEPWNIMNCVEGINPAQVYNADGSLGAGLLGGLGTTGILIALGLAYFLLRKK